jgi:hypothetical protein
MSRKNFVIVYADGSKKNIGSTERNSLLLSKEIRLLEGMRYEYAAKVRTYHSFADLSKLRHRGEFSKAAASYLRGLFIVIDVKGRTFTEKLETPAGWEVRLHSIIAREQRRMLLQAKTRASADLAPA